MDCFNHASIPAVGLCKSCSKGVCSECAIDVGNGLACRGACEESVRRINRMIEANIEMTPDAVKTINSHRPHYHALFLMALGGVFLYQGAEAASYEGQSLLNMGVVVGVVFAAYGLLVLLGSFRPRGRGSDSL
jgi:hypothetical protein